MHDTDVKGQEFGGAGPVALLRLRKGLWMWARFQNESVIVRAIILAACAVTHYADRIERINGSRHMHNSTSTTSSSLSASSILRGKPIFGWTARGVDPLSFRTL
jgi:hypothetical protein